MDQLPPGNGRDWTEEERAQIRRLEEVCQNTAHWKLEYSHTDAGDPWCIIYDQQQHRIVLHIARIDRRYIVVTPFLQRSATKATMAAAIEHALFEMIPA